MARGKLEPWMKQWKKWESGNPKWQPRKGISAVNHELQQAGYSPATKQDIEANYMAMIQLWQDTLLELANNRDKPMIVRIIAKNMLSGKGFDIIEKMLDRWIWKPIQTQAIEARIWGQIAISDDDKAMIEKVLSENT